MPKGYDSRKRSISNFFKPPRLNITLKGERGKPLRIIICSILALTLIIIASNLFRPNVQLMSTAEVQRITSKGVLTVGIRDDVPNFAEAGEGLEVELAKLFSEYLMPEAAEGTAIKYVNITDKTASTKLYDGSVDAVLGLMQRGASSQYAYSYSYYTDTCHVAIPEGGESKPFEDMIIGYVQNTAAANTLNDYVSEHETKIEMSIIDKLLNREKELPEGAITFETKAFASYPDMLSALENGRIDGAAIADAFINKYDEEFNFDVHKDSLGYIEYAIAVSSDEPAIAQLADIFIYEMQKNGELDKLLEKYNLK